MANEAALFLRFYLSKKSIPAQKLKGNCICAKLCTSTYSCIWALIPKSCKRQGFPILTSNRCHEDAETTLFRFAHSAIIPWHVGTTEFFTTSQRYRCARLHLCWMLKPASSISSCNSVIQGVVSLWSLCNFCYVLIWLKRSLSSLTVQNNIPTK